MQYRLRIPKLVQRQIEQLPVNIRQRVKQAIARLVLEPRPANASELEDELAGFWRIKLDDHRVIYTIDDDLVVVVVVEVGRVARRTPKTYADLV